MSEQETLWLNYNGTAGYVQRPASKERAVREVKDGSLSARQLLISDYLETAWLQGMTWKQLSDKTSLHHGQVSGALSNLHSAGVVFMLRAQRNKCHPYILARFRAHFADDEVFDEPVRTRNGTRNALLTELLEVCRTGDAVAIAKQVKRIDNA